MPLLNGFAFLQIDKLAAIVGAFTEFSLDASATYMVNDLWDLDNDRAHPRKRHRPFASALITIKASAGVAAVLLAIALVLPHLFRRGFLMLEIYLVITCGYSWVLKEYVLVDVVVLSILYTVHIIAGSVTVQVSVNNWLLAFSVFLSSAWHWSSDARNSSRSTNPDVRQPAAATIA